MRRILLAVADREEVMMVAAKAVQLWVCSAVCRAARTIANADSTWPPIGATAVVSVLSAL